MGPGSSPALTYFPHRLTRCIFHDVHELPPLMETRPRTVSGLFIAPQSNADARTDLRPPQTPTTTPPTLLDVPAVPSAAYRRFARSLRSLTMLRLRKLRPRTLASLGLRSLRSLRVIRRRIGSLPTGRDRD